jgi:hypothetical protein
VEQSEEGPILRAVAGEAFESFGISDFLSSQGYEGGSFDAESVDLAYGTSTEGSGALVDVAGMTDAENTQIAAGLGCTEYSTSVVAASDWVVGK